MPIKLDEIMNAEAKLKIGIGCPKYARINDVNARAHNTGTITSANGSSNRRKIMMNPTTRNGFTISNDKNTLMVA